MPEKETMRRARRDKRQGKAATTQAGEFVREEIEHVREGKHGARSTKQAIAIGLSKARRAGVKLGTPKNASASTKRSAKSASRLRGRKASPRRARRRARAPASRPDWSSRSLPRRGSTTARPCITCRAQPISASASPPSHTCL